MTFVAAPLGVRTVLKASYHGEDIVNILHFKGAWAEPTGTNLQDLNSKVQQWWVDNIGPLVASDHVLKEISSTDVSRQNGATAVLSTNEAGTMANSTHPLAGNVALCVSKRTAKRGRSFRGRFYLGGLNDAQVDQTNPNNAHANLYNGLLDAFDALNTAVQVINPAIVHVIASYFFNGSPRAEAVLEPIISYVVNAAFDSQRKRLAGRGT